jgi:AcrR family transcriptional regulator
LGIITAMTPSSTPDLASTPAIKGRAPKRRSERAREAVLKAADDLLVERGYAGVTIEGIAARAGVAKQTIYRWWPSKFEVLMDTFLEDAEDALQLPDTGTTTEDLRQHLQALTGFLTTQPAGRVLQALIGQAQQDPAVAEVFRRRYLTDRHVLDRTILERGIARGDLPPGLDLDLTIDLLHGPIYHRILLTGLPIDNALIDTLVDHVLPSLTGIAPHVESATSD